MSRSASVWTPHELTVIGQVEEGGLFFPHLRLTASVTTVPGSNRLVIHDRIENRSAQPAETQLLYHCNVGPPFLEGGSRLVTPFREMAPLTPRAAEGIDTFETYAGPTTGFAEQVYVYDSLGDAHGRTLALLYNAAADRGLAVHWNRNELPCFTVLEEHGRAGRRLRHRHRAGDELPELPQLRAATGSGADLAAGRALGMHLEHRGVRQPGRGEPG